MMKRLMLGLLHFQSTSFQRSLSGAIDTIHAAIRMTKSPRPYVAFSGGKDSAAVAALVHSVRDDVPLIWSDDELEFPETVDLMDHLRQSAPDHFIAYRGSATHAGWFTSWRTRPYFRDPLPGTKSLRQGQSLRDEVVADGYNLTFLGTRADENRRRRDWFLRKGANYYWREGCVRSCPIAGWSADDVWALLAGWKLGVNLAYRRFEMLGLDDVLWRVGPLPLVPRATLASGWPELLSRLELKYGPNWS